MNLLEQFKQTLAAMTASKPVLPAVPNQACTSPIAVLNSNLISADLLKHFNVKESEAWAVSLSNACVRHDINTRLRIAAFLANGLHETNSMIEILESLNYSSSALLEKWPSHFAPTQADQYGRTATHAANQQQIAELAYGGRMGNGPPGSGDGWKFRGTGFMQTTGREQFTILAKICGKNIDDMSEWMQTKDGASESAAFFWKNDNCNIPADKGDIITCRRIVNGGLIGIEETTIIYNQILKLI